MNFKAKVSENADTRINTRDVKHGDNYIYLEKIIAAIKTNYKIIKEELARLIGKSKRTVSRIIRDSGLINFVGNSKTGYREIKDPSE